jgi:pantetheine-phosphate adenylyltransferase
MSPTITNISGIRESVIAFGRFIPRPRRTSRGAVKATSERNTLAAQPSRLASGPTPMRHCIYPGTFDPITCGHLDVLSRASRLFDRVTVAIAESPGKDPLFTPGERLAMILPNVAPLKNVRVVTFGGLLVDFAMEQGADAIIRGLRALSDFEFEFNMALMNRHIQPKIETIFVMPNEQFSYTSSSLVKQVARYGGPVGHFVPANVARALKKAYAG